MKFLKGWRTVAFNLFSAALLLMAMPEFLAVVPADWQLWIALATAVGNICLRSITTTPMGQKE